MLFNNYLFTNSDLEIVRNKINKKECLTPYCVIPYIISIYMFNHHLTAFKQNLKSIPVYQTTELKLFNMTTTFILCNVYYKSFLSLKKKKKHTHKPCACLNPNNNNN